MNVLKPWPANTVACLCCRPDDPFWRDYGDSVDRFCFNCERLIKARPATVAHHDSLPRAEYLCIQCAHQYATLSGAKTAALPKTPAQCRELSLPVPSKEKFIRDYLDAHGTDTPALRLRAALLYYS